jgi:hypothetical protein
VSAQHAAMHIMSAIRPTTLHNLSVNAVARGAGARCFCAKAEGPTRRGKGGAEGASACRFACSVGDGSYVQLLDRQEKTTRHGGGSAPCQCGRTAVLEPELRCGKDARAVAKVLRTACSEPLPGEERMRERKVP